MGSFCVSSWWHLERGCENIWLGVIFYSLKHVSAYSFLAAACGLPWDFKDMIGWFWFVFSRKINFNLLKWISWIYGLWRLKFWKICGIVGYGYLICWRVVASPFWWLSLLVVCFVGLVLCCSVNPWYSSMSAVRKCCIETPLLWYLLYGLSIGKL